jgi:hypothetical protein
LNNQMKMFPKFWMREEPPKSYPSLLWRASSLTGKSWKPLVNWLCVRVRVLSKTFANPLSPQFRRSHKGPEKEKKVELGISLKSIEWSVYSIKCLWWKYIGPETS